MAYLRFFFTHPRVLSFGVLLTLFSSFGQTFLISIFVPQLLETFNLTTAQFGALYASATLLSASSLAYFGRLIDRITLRTFSLSVGVGLVNPRQPSPPVGRVPLQGAPVDRRLTT